MKKSSNNKKTPSQVFNLNLTGINGTRTISVPLSRCTKQFHMVKIHKSVKPTTQYQIVGPNLIEYDLCVNGRNEFCHYQDLSHLPADQWMVKLMEGIQSSHAVMATLIQGTHLTFLLVKGSASKDIVPDKAC